MGEKFADVAAEIAQRKGFRVLQCIGPTPTPTMSHAIRSNQAAGGINFTASHNPPEYQGIKFSTADGAPALPEVTKRIEDDNRRTVARTNMPAAHRSLDPRPAYLDDLKTKINFDAIADGRRAICLRPAMGNGPRLS